MCPNIILPLQLKLMPMHKEFLISNLVLLIKSTRSVVS